MPVVAGHGRQPGGKADYTRNPLIVYWETTVACGLACRHCRAEAMPERNPAELDRKESGALLRQLAGFGKPLPHLILTGGDPLRRADLFDLIASAASLGLEVSITPSATRDLKPEVLSRLKASGIRSLGLSIDGSTPERHDSLRKVDHCFEWTLAAARTAAELSMPIQVNTLVSEETAVDLPHIYDLMCTLKVMRWSLFFLIAVGRGRVLKEVPPERGEEIMRWIYDRSLSAPFAIKTTEAPTYRRIALSRMRESGMTPEDIARTSVYHGFGIRDGHGIMFVSSIGDVYPAGFLPLAAGNVRTADPVAVYRESPPFVGLHDPDRFKGKCGRCEYRSICGGSRSRAFARTGDPLESDLFCTYEPK